MFFLLLSLSGMSQSTISGKVVDKDGAGIPGVNIFIENTYDGGSSDESGNFSFKTSETGPQTLLATSIGFKTWTETIELPSNRQFEIVLQESVNTIDAVTITAGSFTADDEGRASVMKTLDIYTTPSAVGDVMGAIRTMPGTQASADDGRLLVRGGDVYETSTYIDGLVAAKPYYSKTPDVATRGRFSPSLFSGVQFNTGGYSAEYGQALSSVLILNSTDVAEQNNTGLSFMSLGGEINRTQSWGNSSLMLSGGFYDFRLYDKIFNSSIDWQKPVRSYNGTAVYHIKPRSSGLFKAYVTADYGDLAYNVPAGNEGSNMLISNKGTTTYSNFSYRDCIGEKTCYRVGVSTTFQDNKTGLDTDQVNTREWNIESRFAMIHDISEGVKLTWGGNETSRNYNQDYLRNEGLDYKGEFIDHLGAAFVESEIKFSKNLTQNRVFISYKQLEPGSPFCHCIKNR